MKPIPVGAKGSYSFVVDQSHLASTLDASLAQVMSTPSMIAAMEMASLDAIRPYYDAGESSVGAGITVEHTAATPPSHRVRAEAEVTKVDGRRIELIVRAFDETGEIGSATHRRAIVDAAKFNECLKSKMKA
ncbi:MAG TPA: thioesterase family protein [Candidatus Binataceae bacterium]|nr:thioesterase family protein [Candidatus Binataceae bacterium]